VKKKQIFLLVAIFVVIFGIFGFIFWLKTKTFVKKPVSQEKEKTITEKQIEELEKLRGSRAPLTEEEIEKQKEELEKMREGTKPLSQEEIQKQLEELEKLRQQ